MKLYLFVTKKIIFRYISAPVAWFDRHIVDGTMNAIAARYTGCLIQNQRISVGSAAEICICLYFRGDNACNIIYLPVEITDN